MDSSGEWLRAVRESKEMTQEAFAAWVNSLLGRRYDRNVISGWETGGRRLPADVAGLIALHQIRFTRRNETIVVGVALQKGGVGKTSICANLGYALSRSARVLLIDGDSQGNLTAHVGLSPERVSELAAKELTHYECLMGKKNISDVIVRTEFENLDIIPATIALALAERELAGRYNKPYDMREMIKPIKDKYDVIIIDCPPSLGTITINALVASDCVLIPVQVEKFALTGLQHLVGETIEAVRSAHNPRMKILAFIPTLFSARQTQDQESLDEMKTVFGGFAPILTPIPRAAIYAQTASRGLITIQFDTSAPGLGTFVEIIELMERANG